MSGFVKCVFLLGFYDLVSQEYPNLGYSKSGYSVCGMNVNANKVCGRCLARMRKASGLTQVGLAKKLGLPQSFVSKVETGERCLRVYEQFSYAKALGIDLSEFMRQLENDLYLSGALDLRTSSGRRGHGAPDA